MKGEITLRYFLLHKPFGVLCQFTDPEGGKKTLADLASFPKDVYPVGRLDEDSEGLLILTNDSSVNMILNGNQTEKEYRVQVEGAPTPAGLSAFQTGISLNIRGKIEKCLPAEADILEDQNPFPERNPPVRFRKQIPTTWISVRIREGKNRQVRKMTAACGFPTLRLVRYRIGKLTLGELGSGEWKEVQKRELHLPESPKQSKKRNSFSVSTDYSQRFQKKARNKPNGNKI